jgi:hypothetical protein
MALEYARTRSDKHRRKRGRSRFSLSSLSLPCYGKRRFRHVTITESSLARRGKPSFLRQPGSIIKSFDREGAHVMSLRDVRQLRRFSELSDLILNRG